MRAFRPAKSVLLAFLLLFILPLVSHAAWWWHKGWPSTWSGADWSSARLLPGAAAEPDAVVHVLAARVGNWRGIFAHHSWIVVKASGAAPYVRYDVVGWGRPVRMNVREVDGRWYGNEPQILLTLRGAAAERAIPRIRAAVGNYPFQEAGQYRPWPGPNSNTFVAFLAGEVPELTPALLPTAIGKDYRSEGWFAGQAPSGRGLQLSWRGMLGLTVGPVEGVEVNLLGFVAGVDVRRPAIKLPGWGRIGLAPA